MEKNTEDDKSPSYFCIPTFHQNKKIVEICVSAKVISNYVPKLKIPMNRSSRILLRALMPWQAGFWFS